MTYFFAKRLVINKTPKQKQKYLIKATNERDKK